MQELGLGQLTLHQAEQIFSLLDNRRRVLETHELAQHVRAIEDMFGTKISDICDTLHTPPKQSEL
jgi:hypothetical protein